MTRKNNGWIKKRNFCKIVIGIRLKTLKSNDKDMHLFEQVYKPQMCKKGKINKMRSFY